MSHAVSPLAPKHVPEMPAIAGVRIATGAAGIKYQGRTDVLLALFDKDTAVAGVLTRSKCPSAPVEWCRAKLKGGRARALVVNSGNANAFTGKTGREATAFTAKLASAATGCKPAEVFLASTGVIGEPLPAQRFDGVMQGLVDKAEPGQRTDFTKPFLHFQQFLHRRGIVVVISDFYAEPDQVIERIAPLRGRGNEVALFHVLDPEEVRPRFRDPVVLVDVETEDMMEVSPDYARQEYRARIDAHISALKQASQAAGIDYFLATTDRPLDAALREYLFIRQGRL